MLRWVFVVASLQLACLQTEAVELSSDSSREAETFDEVETLDDPEVIGEGPETTAPQACLSVAPAEVSFGGMRVGATSAILVNLVSCGDKPLVVSSVALSDDAEGQFSIQSLDSPVALAPGEVIAFEVAFFPSQVAAVDANNQPVRTKSSLVITSNAGPGEIVVPVDGYGVDANCPTAVIGVAEGDEVVPQTLLSLDGSQSSSPRGSIVTYEWSVTQPQGSLAVLLPSASAAAPVFEANVVGRYVFRLEVIDELGVRSCTPAEYEVIVGGQDDIHIEVLWNTPGDTNQTDSGANGMQSGGSDVDLHFLSPKANGQLYAPTYDCYFANPNPEWGAFGADDNPHLDRDDSDGAGPENLNIDKPEDGARYQVSVHYYDDWGFGDSDVTVRVYVAGVLRDEWSTWLTMNDQWDVYYIDWPSGLVTRINNGVPQVKQTIADN